MGKENHLSNGGGIDQEHGQAVDAHAKRIGSNDNLQPTGHEVFLNLAALLKRNNPRVRIIDIATRRTPTSDYADLYVEFVPGSDLALANGILHILVRDRKISRAFLDENVVFKRGIEDSPANRTRFLLLSREAYAENGRYDEGMVALDDAFLAVEDQNERFWEAELQAAAEVESSLYRFLKSREQLAYLTESAQSARQSLELSTIQYTEGETDFLRVDIEGR